MDIYIYTLIMVILSYVFIFKTNNFKNPKKIFCITIFVLFSLIQGLRSSEVGIDTKNYISFFEISKNSNFINILLLRQWVIEPLFGIIIKICSFIGMNENLYLLFIAVLINGGLMHFLYKNSENVLVSVIMFMGVEYFTLSFTAIRQMLAIVILLYSYNCMKKNELLKFLLIVLIASLIHKTSLIFLPLYLLRNIKVNKKTIIIGFGLLSIIQLFCLPLILDITKNLFSKDYLLSDGSGIKQALVILVYLVFGLIVYFKTKKDMDNLLFVFMYAAFCLQSMAYRISMIARLMFFFYIFVIVFLPMVTQRMQYEIKIYKMKMKMGEICNFGFMFLAIVQYFMFSINAYNLIPYHFCF